MSNNLDIDYLNLVRDIIENGRIKKDRTGTGTLSVFGRTLRHDMSTGFPLLTTKKMSLKNIKSELYWFLQGDTNIKFLVDRGCNIWNGDAYKHYLDNCGDKFPLTMKDFIHKIKTNPNFCREWGELGPIYGAQWKNWDGIDQIGELLNGLIEKPDSRRLMVNAWNVSDLSKMTLPPCHFGFQCYTEELTYLERYELWFENAAKKGGIVEYNPDVDNPIDLSSVPSRKLSLCWYQRSVDTGLGLPYNIASYGLLLLMLADEVNMVPGDLIGQLGDVHLYLNHINPIQEQLSREGYLLPTVKVRDGIHSHPDGDDIILENYEAHPKIDLPLSN